MRYVYFQEDGISNSLQKIHSVIVRFDINAVYLKSEVMSGTTQRITGGQDFIQDGLYVGSSADRNSRIAPDIKKYTLARIERNFMVEIKSKLQECAPYGCFFVIRRHDTCCIVAY